MALFVFRIVSLLLAISCSTSFLTSPLNLLLVGMVVESMAGKSAALHGYVHDASPFKFSEENPSSAHFGELLRKAGYNYHGTEKMYSGKLTSDLPK